jgi:hypothetical protein
VLLRSWGDYLINKQATGISGDLGTLEMHIFEFISSVLTCAFSLTVVSCFVFCESIHAAADLPANITHKFMLQVRYIYMLTEEEDAGVSHITHWITTHTYLV